MSSIGGKGATLFGMLLGAALVFATPGEAQADFRICNKTASHVGISIGYKDASGWKTEGWWNIAPQSCDVVLSGELVSRYYYIYAVDYDIGGEWGGRAVMCTQDKLFTIRGVEDCKARGYTPTGFFEIDTGASTTWTVQLTEPGQQGTGGQ